MTKVYFAGSIRGGREGQPVYEQLIQHIQKSGTEVLCEHVGYKDLTDIGQSQDSRFIHDRDLGWIRESDGVITEVTNPSLGVGYEIGKATEWGKPVLALFHDNGEKRLSAMIDGSPEVETVNYQDISAATLAIDRFLEKL